MHLAVYLFRLLSRYYVYLTFNNGDQLVLVTPQSSIFFKACLWFDQIVFICYKTNFREKT